MSELDEKLCYEFNSGDLTAFEELVRRWEKDILNLAYRYLSDSEDAKDVTQEIFIKLFLNANKFNGRSSFKTWLYRVAVNSIIDYSRKQSTKKRKELNNSPHHLLKKDDGDEDSHNSLEKKEMKKMVKRAMSDLPKKQRVVLLLKEYNDLSFNEISEILNCPVSTVKSRLYKGLSNMKNIIEANI